MVSEVLFPDLACSREYLGMEHDQLFKQLFTTFFREFIELFFPNVAAFLDPEVKMVPLSKEIFTDIESKERYIVDLLMQGKFKGQDAYFRIHVENQATAQSDFPRRMFGDFSHLHVKYRMPVYPIVIFSYDAPTKAEPRHYMITFPNKTVMRFEYDVVQLNRLPWRRFLKSNNPVATALMAKMKIAPRDRPKAKAELLCILASHKLDPARTRLLGQFIDRYLVMSAGEMKVFEREIAGFTLVEGATVMEFVTSWELKGMERVVNRLIRKRLGIVSEDITARIDRLSPEQLDELSDVIFDFTSIDDLEQWLARH